MTAPGGSYGEGAHDGAASPPPTGDQPPEQPVYHEPWASPGSSAPVADYPPSGFTAPGYLPGDPSGPPGPPGYPPDYAVGYPPQIPPSGYPPPGYSPYGAPSGGYGGAPFPPPMPPSYPGGYYPAPDYMGAYGPSQPGMNTMAIVSLVSSLVGVFCCIGSIVSI